MTDTPPPADTDSPAPPPRRRRTRAIVVGAVVVVVVAAAAVAAFGIDFSSASPATTIRMPPATGKVTRMTLTDTEKVDGTLGYGDQHPVTVRGTGTITALPSSGATVQRGQPVFRRDDLAVPLFYGTLPFYRALRSGVSGADVKELPHSGLADQVTDHTAKHGALRLDAGLDLGQAGDDLVADRAVGGEVVFPAEQVVVDPGRVRPRRVEVAVGGFAVEGFGGHRPDRTHRYRSAG